MSLYAEYIKERENKDIVETSEGFATYVFTDQGVYIVDLYVKPDFRKTHVASELADKIAIIAKERGHSKMFGTVNLTAAKPTLSLKVLLAYGMALSSCGNNYIVLEKEI